MSISSNKYNIGGTNEDGKLVERKEVEVGSGKKMVRGSACNAYSVGMIDTSCVCVRVTTLFVTSCFRGEPRQRDLSTLLNYPTADA